MPYRYAHKTGGAYHSTKNSGTNFRKFPWANGTVNGREQRVVIDGVNSSSCSIPSGVPQGSLLGPLFCVIFINDLPEVVTPENTVSLYADDCKTSRVITCPADHSQFQSDIDNIHTYIHILFYLVSYTSYIDIVPNKFTSLQFSNVN